MQLELDTIDLFGGTISSNGNLYFPGEIKNSWCILYRDLTNVETTDFFLIIKPFDDAMVHQLYFFRNLKEAMLLFQIKNKSYFKNARIVIAGMKSIPFVKAFLKQKFTENKMLLPRLNFFHSPEYFDLVTLYLEILDKGISYQTIQIEGKTELNIQYKNIEIQLSHHQISKSKICFLLGINDRKFSVRNHFLYSQIINQNLYW